MVMQQFASGSLMNALPPSLALAAFIATLLPQHFSPAPPGNIEGGQVNREQPIAIQDVERMLESPINVESHDPVSSGSRSQILVPHQSGRTRRQTA
ncbi:hypothetical protein K432DRAFT_85121 [Lepidopterella palustris CBS 459.81]|uniref:Uncharacterized protein n=1 Tax=Lepidopterella palustris CBS 459.81 TaxID=1314670 RepID=A0A8E2E7S4_9PEZI|nr:hypothetical protein K432DRAFT_85121 [Lepidopterella palustris CBS 459.81]